MNSIIVVGILNQNRFDLLERTMLSITKALGDKALYIMHDNGSDQHTMGRIRACQWYRKFKQVKWAGKNIGIGGGMNSLRAMARKLDAAYYIHLENDWECMRNGDWLQHCLDIMTNNPQIGIIKLRKQGDGQYEMYPENVLKGEAEKYSPWWLSPLPEYVKRGEGFWHCQVERGYTNNPTFLRMAMVEGWEMKDDVQGYGLEEEDWESRPANEGWETANLFEGVFRHVG
jgi:hypothetical protein